MDWKERLRPSNAAEVGCLIFLVGIPLAVGAIALDLQFIPQIAVGAWLIFYAFRFGYQAHVTYEVSKTIAIIVSGLLALAYFLIWIGILVAIMFGLSDFIGQYNSWLPFLLGMVLALTLYFHLFRFKQTIYEKWLGWQPKEGIADG